MTSLAFAPGPALAPVPAAVPPDLLTLVAALFLLFGIPAILFGLIMLYTGYVRHDGDRYVEELEAADGGDGSGGTRSASALEDGRDE